MSKNKDEYPEERENQKNKAPGFKDLEQEPKETDDDIVMGTEADVTPEDLEILGDKDKDMDMGADEQMEGTSLDERDDDGTRLNEASGDTIETGEDLDVPGSELDDPNENIGEEDEENNYYSRRDD